MNDEMQHMLLVNSPIDITRISSDSLDISIRRDKRKEKEKKKRALPFTRSYIPHRVRASLSSIHPTNVEYLISRSYPSRVRRLACIIRQRDRNVTSRGAEVSDTFYLVRYARAWKI